MSYKSWFTGEKQQFDNDFSSFGIKCGTRYGNAVNASCMILFTDFLAKKGIEHLVERVYANEKYDEYLVQLKLNPTNQLADEITEGAARFFNRAFVIAGPDYFDGLFYPNSFEPEPEFKGWLRKKLGKWLFSNQKESERW